MHIFQFLIVIVVIISALCEEEDVLEFTDSDFEARIAEYPTALVLYYAPWCNYCNSLKPEFARAAKDLVRNDPPVALIQMDCTESAVITCDKYSINSYPKLIIYQFGEYLKNYDGSREAQEIIKYMKAEARNPIKEIKSFSHFTNILNTTKDPVVIGFFKTKSNLNAVFFEIAKKLKCQFAFSADRIVLQKQGVSNGVVLFRPIHLKNKFESVSVRYLGTANTTELSDFIIDNFYGLVGVRTLKNRVNFKRPLIVVYFAIDYDKNPKRSAYWRNRVLIVAKEFKGKVTFAVSSSEELVEELNNVGMDPIKLDTPVAVATDLGGRKSILKKEFSVENLKIFTNDFLNGYLEMYIKSEPIPKIQYGPVLVAVAKNFKEVVLNNGKDTLINFYDPSCGQSKILVSVFEELAETLSEEDIAIVRMNAVANDIPLPYKVSEYPTVYWAPKNRKDSPMMFKGDGSVLTFVNFIAQKATNELKGWDRDGRSKYRRFEF